MKMLMRRQRASGRGGETRSGGAILKGVKYAEKKVKEEDDVHIDGC